MDKPNIGIACQVATGKLDSNRAVKGGRYPFFTCAAEPDSIDIYAFDDDVVLVAGNNAQGNFHVSRFRGKFNAYQRTYVLTAKSGYDIEYIYYAMKLELKRLKERSQGSQTKFLTKPILTGIALQNIKYDDQKNISSVLAAIDAKIDVNNRINSELEAMAKALYDYWFLQFDFPNVTGKPYKSSGGKMEYNSTLKRVIPIGWKVSELGAEIKTVLGGTPSTKESRFWKDADINWLNSGEIVNFPVVSSEERITREGIYNSAAELLPKGSVVISIVRHIRVSILAVDSATNQSVVGLHETDILRHSYIYPYVSREVPRLMVLRTGAQQPHINKNEIDVSPLITPPGPVLKIYYQMAEPIYKKIMAIAFENQKLIELRDWLLPMLMNGQVKVTNSNKIRKVFALT